MAINSKYGNIVGTLDKGMIYVLNGKKVAANISSSYSKQCKI
jgi:hypothetical protein